MFVVLVTYFVIITRVLRNNHMKNQIILLMVMIMMIMLMDMETILMSSLMSNWKCKIQNQNGTSFHHIYRESKQII